MSDIEKAATEFVTKCWQEVGEHRDFIYVSQITQVIDGIEKKLNSKNLLTKTELKILDDMMTDKPLLKLYQAEFKSFILKLVNYSSLEKFILDRTGITQFNLKLLLNQSSNMKSSDNSSGTGIRRLSPLKSNHMNSPMKTSTPVKTKTVDNANSPLRSNGFKTNLDLREKQIEERDNQISILSKENTELFHTNKSQLEKIKELEFQYKDLKYYVDILETKFDDKNHNNKNNGVKSDRLILKDLIKQCSERDETIKKLEEVCSQYQQEFDKLKNNSVIQNLTTNINRQEQLIGELKAKLMFEQTQNLQSSQHQVDKHGINISHRPIDNSSNEHLQQFIAKIPILKQYYMYYRYKEQHKNLGIVIINVLTILVSGGVIITALRIIGLLLLQLFNSNDSRQLEYIFDDYGINNWNFNQEEKITFVWWKEIEWIEYLVYTINEWLEKTP